MKGNRAIAIIGLGVLAVMMGVTNPKPEEYTEYASERLINKSEKFICDKFHYCDLQNMPIFAKNTLKNQLIKPLVTSTTKRQNWILFSDYVTEMPGIGAIKSIGAFGSFFTYSEAATTQ